MVFTEDAWDLFAEEFGPEDSDKKVLGRTRAMFSRDFRATHDSPIPRTTNYSANGRKGKVWRGLAIVGDQQPGLTNEEMEEMMERELF